MNRRKDEYMRGYGDGFKDGRADVLPAVNAAFLALCDMPFDSLTSKGFEAIAELGRAIAEASTAPKADAP